MDNRALKVTLTFDALEDEHCKPIIVLTDEFDEANQVKWSGIIAQQSSEMIKVSLNLEGIRVICQCKGMTKAQFVFTFQDVQ
ncbi:hypothetical protein FGO68_gene14518 [Halteria grandinella]|uniref:Uncharacterized protein n=1 Tax=Halteria grandinella TaxID=5974 RepID=A0A8J8NNE2_HALGN|nr:hypothetical protein FGO68_gene14518 [Halteria grandinella]